MQSEATEKALTNPKILVMGPWGYNMCLNNFYVVLSETPFRARIRDIGSRCVRSEQDGFAGYEVPAFNENVNYREYTIVKRQKPDGSVEYRGKAGLSIVRTLEVVKPGQEFYFNNLD